MQCAPTTRNVREVSQGYRGGDIFRLAPQLSRSIERRRAHDGAFQQNSPEPLALTLSKWLWASTVLAIVVLGLATPTQAASTTMATWDGSANSNWNSSANWTPKGPPTDTATFPAVSNQVVRFPSSTTTIGQQVFTAPGYMLNITSGNSTLVFTGLGIYTGAGAFSDPNNRPIVNIAGSGDTAAFLNNSTGGLARFIIGSGGILDLSIHSVPSNMTAGSIVNSGLIDLGNPDGSTVGNSLTVFGSYVGTGGTIHLNTFLAADGSPSDRLVIDGGQPTIDGAATATGMTFLKITNAGGPGAQTTNNGILVVDAINGGTTAPGAFALSGEVRAGAFDYFLFRGGLNSGIAPNDWFLRSTFLVEPIPPSTQPIPPLALPNGLPPDPPSPTLPPGLWPIIGPELATDGVVQPIARQMGLQTLGTLHQRIGDTLTFANTGGEGAGVARSDWARFFGQGIDNRYQAFADPQATGWMGGFQGGVDLLRTSFLPGHRDVAGVYLAFANSDISVNGLVTNAAATGYVQTRTGTVGLNGYSAGGYWTHYGPTGWYIDAVLQGTYYNGNAITQFANLPINGSGFISSLEGGYPIPLPLGPRFVLEPQAQIIWQQVAFNQANDGLGPVGLGTTSGETGRVGLRGMWTIDGYNGQVWQPYVRANLWRDWGAEATTMFGIDPVPLIEEATRLEFAGGVTALLGRGVSLYAQVGYQFALDNVYLRNGIQGDIGLRYVW
jgi:outer membrane autotransporter protein